MFDFNVVHCLNHLMLVHNKLSIHSSSCLDFTEFLFYSILRPNFCHFKLNLQVLSKHVQKCFSFLQFVLF